MGCLKKKLSRWLDDFVNPSITNLRKGNKTQKQTQTNVSHSPHSKKLYFACIVMISQHYRACAVPLVACGDTAHLPNTER